MKASLTCPKCGGRKLWRIERMQVAAVTMGGRPADVAVAVESRTFGGLKPHGAFETFICDGCGFTEWYAHSLPELQPDPARGIHFIDDEPRPGTEGPLR